MVPEHETQCNETVIKKLFKKVDVHTHTVHSKEIQDRTTTNGKCPGPTRTKKLFSCKCNEHDMHSIYN